MRNDVFRFIDRTWDASTGEARFNYELIHGGETFSFTDKLIFPVADTTQDIPQALLDSVLDNLFLILGVSYYKLYCPKNIELGSLQLNQEQAVFWNSVYTKGLGEFFYKNQIDFLGLVSFPISEGVQAQAIPCSRRDRSLVGIGGGKDSIVAGELLKKHGKEFTAFVNNDHPIRDEVVAMMQIGKISVKHVLDPLLLELNKREDSYNGHVPVSAQIAFTGLLAALLYDYRYVIVGNEQSANYGNTEYLGEDVNHQWSKSYEFETMLQDYVKHYVTESVVYFSLLRPFSELAIAKELTHYPQYFPVFSSCNRNFRINNAGDRKWCGECPKCAFSFIMLAAFLSKDEVVQLFGKNLLADESLLMTYKELLGVAEIKPFDCVGTPDEVRVAFFLTNKDGAYANDPVMQFFINEVQPKIGDTKALHDEVLSPSANHHVPEAFTEVITL